MNHYLVQSPDGKTFKPSSFNAALTVIAIHFDVYEHDVRVLTRSPNSWYVYRNESDMLADARQRQRTNWIAIVQLERAVF